MPQDPFPDRGPDGEEPASSPLPPAAEGDGPEDDWEGPGEQGLYVCLPPEQVTLAGFAQNGEADTMAPGAVLAAVVDTVVGEDGGGLAGCSDDQLLGIISAARRLESRAGWAQLAAIAEFAARHPRGTVAGEFAADELAFELHLTQPSAAGQMDYASIVARRLPATVAALAAGRIHPVHLRIIAEETSILSDPDMAKADQVLAEAAPGLTFGEVRAAVSHVRSETACCLASFSRANSSSVFVSTSVYGRPFRRVWCRTASPAESIRVCTGPRPDAGRGAFSARSWLAGHHPGRP